MNGRRGFGLSTAIAGGALVIAGLVVAPGAAGATQPVDGVHKVTICHAVDGLGETKHGYNVIEVDIASIVTPQNESQDHGHHVHDGRTDIIPPFDYTNGDGVMAHYSGLGDASWIASGCIAPVTTTTSVTTTTTTVPPDTTVTTLPPDTTVTTLPPATTQPPDTTAPATTTTELGGEQGTTTTSVASEAPTTTVAGALPSTGGHDGILVAVGALMVLVGAVTLLLGRRPDGI